MIHPTRLSLIQILAKGGIETSATWRRHWLRASEHSLRPLPRRDFA
jgi:hypothetical protein